MPHSLVAIVFLLFGMAWAADEPTKKVLPDEAAIKNAQGLIKDVFKDDLKKTKPEDRKALAKKMLEQANDPANDAGLVYALLLEAGSQAAQAGDVEKVVTAAEEIGKRYDGDTFSVRLDLLGKIGKQAKTSETAQAISEAYLKLADNAVATEKFDVATKAATEAGPLAAKTKDVGLAARAKNKAGEIQNMAKETKAAAEARKKLDAAPDDPEANLVVGRYTCFIKGDWDAGLKMLAKGSDEKLKAIGLKDTESTDKPDAMVAMGDSWWNFGDKEKSSTVKTSIQRRARFWYEKALPDIGGLVKAKIEKRMAEGPPAVADANATNRKNILGQVDLPGCVVAGIWKKEKGELITDDSSLARAEIPVNVPEEYDFSFSFTKKTGGRAVVAFLPHANGLIMFQLGWEGTVGFEIVDGKRSNENASTKPGIAQNGKKSAVIVKVRKKRIEAFLDNRMISSLDISPNMAFSVHPGWAMRNASHIGIGADHGQTIFHDAKIQPAK